MLGKIQRMIKHGRGKEKESLITSIKNSGKEVIQEISISYFQKQNLNKAKGDINLPHFELFLDAFNNIILNNKSKQGFSKGEALKKTGEKMNSDILFMLSNLLIYPMQLKTILKRQKDKNYSIFEDIILEESLNKTIKMIEYIKQYIKKEKMYLEMTKKPVMSIFSNLYLQGIILSVVMIMILPYMLISKEMVSYQALLSQWPGWELNLASMFIGLTYNSFEVKLVFASQILILFGSLAGIIIFTAKFAFKYFEEKRKRTGDKLIDELKFISFLKIKIQKLHIGTITGLDGKQKNHYLSVRYINFLIDSNNDAYNKGLLSYEFNKELSRVLTLFLATKNKVMTRNGSEFFYNQLDLILVGYQSWINGTNYNFNLDFIKNKFEDAEETLTVLFNESHKQSTALIASTMMLLVLVFVGIASLYQFSQSTNLGKVMRYDMKQNQGN